eukprot:271095-Rhodomonas_salina.2
MELSAAIAGLCIVRLGERRTSILGSVIAVLPRFWHAAGNSCTGAMAADPFLRGNITPLSSFAMLSTDSGRGCQAWYSSTKSSPSAGGSHRVCPPPPPSPFPLPPPSAPAAADCSPVAALLHRVWHHGVRRRDDDLRLRVPCCLETVRLWGGAMLTCVAARDAVIPKLSESIGIWHTLQCLAGASPLSAYVLSAISLRNSPP